MDIINVSDSYIFNKLRHIVDITIDDYPQIVGLVVRTYLLHGIFFTHFNINKL